MWTQLRKKENLERAHTACTLGIVELCLEMGIEVGALAIIVTVLILLREFSTILWVGEQAEQIVEEKVKK